MATLRTLSTRKRVGLVLVVVALFYVVATCFQSRDCDKVLGEGWQDFRLGMSQPQLESLFGPPTSAWVEDGAEFVRWDGRKEYLELELDGGRAANYSYGRQPNLWKRVVEWWQRSGRAKLSPF